MSIMELGALGEFLGSIGVIATLVYLAIQVRHSKESMETNTRVIMAQISQARADAASARTRAIVHSDHYARIGALEMAAKDRTDWASGLSPEDQYRVRMHLIDLLNDVRNQFYQYQQGFLDEVIWRTSTRGQIARLLRDLPHFFPVPPRPIDSEFVALMNAIAKEEGLPLIDESASSGVV